jgi:hypothetical protein
MQLCSPAQVIKLLQSIHSCDGRWYIARLTCWIGGFDISFKFWMTLCTCHHPMPCPHLKLHCNFGKLPCMQSSSNSWQARIHRIGSFKTLDLTFNSTMSCSVLASFTTIILSLRLALISCRCPHWLVSTEP